MGIDSLKRWEEFGGKVGRHCRYCEERHVGCHATCEKYQAAKDEHDTFSKMIQRNKEQDGVLYRHKVQSMQKADFKRSKK